MATFHDKYSRKSNWNNVLPHVYIYFSASKNLWYFYFLPGESLTLLGVVNLWRKRHIRWNTFETSICTRPRPQNAKKMNSEQLPVSRFWFFGPLSSVSLSGDLGRGAACPRGPSRVDTLSRARTSTFAGCLFRCFTICYQEFELTNGLSPIFPLEDL